MEALKQRLSALKANAAADGGENNIVKVTAWKEWKEAKGNVRDQRYCSGTKSAAKASWQQTCAADSGFGEAKWSGSGGHSSPTPRQAVCGRHTRRGFSLSEAESVYASFFSRRRRAPGEAGARAPFKPRVGI